MVFHNDRWKPSVPRRWLVLSAGLMWCGVGIMLIRLSWLWSSAAGWRSSLPFLSIGLFMGLGTQLFFRRMASRNLARIQSLPDDACLFAFQSWTSYPLVGFMIGLGIVLRATELPRTWLAGLYLAIGAGLFVAGSGYFPTIVSAWQQEG